MTRRRKISTDYDIIQTIITNDEKHAIILLVVSLQQEYEIQIFQLNSDTQRPINQITITGTQVYADQIVQNKEGTSFVLPYIDSGSFKLLSFDAKNPQLDLLENINEELKISTKQEPPFGLTYPLINALFIDKEKLFVNLFDQVESSNIYFTYKHTQKRIIDPVLTQIESLDYNNDKSNFPVGLNYDQNKDEVICTYRHGQCLTIKAKQKKPKMKLSRINTKD